MDLLALTPAIVLLEMLPRLLRGLDDERPMKGARLWPGRAEVLRTCLLNDLSPFDSARQPR